MKEWRYIYSGFCHPYANMAIDESLMLNYANTNKPVLRIYGWQPAGFSIGFSQNADSVLDIRKCSKLNIPVVRRLTGGTLIFHDKEITYSLICSQQDLGRPATVKESYKRICKSLFSFYSHFGLKACFSLDEPRSFRSRSGLCFASCQDYDIMIQGKKIGGNAQRRKKSLILQHGSIPLELDTGKIEDFLKEDTSCLYGKTTSLNGLTSQKNDFSTTAGILRKSFERNLSAVLAESGLTEPEQKLAVNLEKNKYSGIEWNNHATFKTKTCMAV